MASINTSQLEREFLIYELNIRGVEVKSSDKTKDLSQNLSAFLRQESQGKVFVALRDLDPISELQNCATILNIVTKAAKSIWTQTLIDRLDSLFWHLRGRIGRIVGETDDQVDQISGLLKEFENIFKDFNDRKKYLVDPPSTETPVDQSSTLASLQTLVLTDPDYVPVTRWNFTFTGKYRESLDVLIFIRKVNQFCKTRKVSESRLLAGIGCLFEDRADVWFRSIVNEIETWADLCSRLKQEFLPRNFEKHIKDMIKNRYQLDDESIGTFIAHVHELSNYLPVPLSKEKSLKIIRENMLPEYQERLILEDIDSEQKLVELVNKIDDRKGTSRLKANSSTRPADNRVTFFEKDILNSDFGKNFRSEYNSQFEVSRGRNSDRSSNNLDHRQRYNRNFDRSSSRDRTFRHNDSMDRNSHRSSRNRSSSRLRNHTPNRTDRYSHNNREASISRDGRSTKGNSSSRERFRNRSSSRNRTDQRQVSSLRCFKCNSTQHLARDCTSKVIKCYRCGLIGYTIRTCPTCLSQGNDSRT